MAELKFYARAGLVYDPTRVRRTGQMPPYVGRSFDPETRGWLPDEEPHVMRVSDSHEGRKHTQRMTKRINEGALWAADEATAKACGVPFVSVEWVDGEWVAKKAKGAKPAAKAASDAQGKSSGGGN